MEEGRSDYREWDEMIPDALGLIFTKLPLEDLLTAIPRVCKSWGKALQEPNCWQEIDIDELTTVSQPQEIDRLLRLLITRSRGSLRTLNVSRIDNDQIFAFIAEHAGSLQSLTMRRSDINDSIVEQLAEKFSSLTSLDLSYCCQIGTRALEAFGKNCKLLSSLSWNMHPLRANYKASYVDEARAIAHTMPKLKHLELAYLQLNDESVLEILSNCPNLEFVDLRGCLDVHLDKKYLKAKHPKLEVVGPQGIMNVLERRLLYDINESDFSEYDYNDYSDDESFDGLWDDEGVQLRIYEDSDDNMYEYGLYPSL